MRGLNAVAGGIMSVTILATLSPCQVPPQGSSPQIQPQVQKEIAIGRQIADDLERKDGKLEDAAIVWYLQRVSNRVATAVGKRPLEIHLTRSPKEYASLLPGTLFISAGLVERINSEAELAGLIAHEFGHGNGLVTRQNQGGIPLMTSACVVATPFGPLRTGVGRDAENQATAAAVDTLKRAGYDPLAMLELLSKLSYEHPVWSKAIDPDDLVSLRAATEPQAVPPGGYELDSSEFIEQRARLVAALGHAKKMPAPTLGVH
jgi:predicted Zn-dependent protease